MSSPFPQVQLAEALILNTDYIDAPEPKFYPKLSVRLYGKGVALDTPADGSILKMKRHQIAKAGQVILSEIWGKRGAIGVVPPEGDGALCTSHFFLFDVRTDRILPGYLQAIFAANYLEDQLGSEAKGTTGYAAVRPRNLLAARIPLPPVDEQRRIVFRIDQLAASVAEANRLRRDTIEEVEGIMASEELRLWQSSDLNNARSLEDVTTFLARGRHSKQGPSDHYLVKTKHVQLGSYVDTNLTLASDEAARVNPQAMVQPGDILIACSAAGCLGRVAFYGGPQKQMSTDTHVAIARANSEIVDPEYLYFYLKGAQGQFQLRSREKGDWRREKVGFRLTELNVADMRRVPVPIPPRAEQKKTIAYLRTLDEKVQTMRKLQSETAAELDALMPSILSKAFRGEL